jgi:hypothetical protein
MFTFFKIVKILYAESTMIYPKYKLGALQINRYLPQYYVNGRAPSSWLITALFHTITISFLLKYGCLPIEVGDLKFLIHGQ